MEKYEKKDLIGEGKFSKVYLGINKENEEEKVAIKEINKSTIDNKIFLKHIEKIKRLKNKNTLDHSNFFEDETNFYFITELCDCNLKVFCDKKEKLEENEIKQIIKELNNSLKEMNDLQIFHREIKLENILVKYNEKNKPEKGFKILFDDIGVLRILMETKNFLFYENEFLAPEFQKAIKEDNIKNPEKVNEKNDLYSIGVLIYYLLFNSIEINKENIKNLENKTLSSLLLKLLKKSNKKRINWNDYFLNEFINDDPDSIEYYMRKDNFKRIEKESNFCTEFFESEDNDDNIKKIFNKEMLNELFEKFEKDPKINEKDIRVKKIDDYNGFYYGECALKKNKEIIKHGRGILVNKEMKAMAKGQFRNNKLTGKVIKIFSDGTYYEGDNKNWVNEGKGFCYFPNDKRIYYGEWKKNRWNGKGTAIFPDGTKYEGEWKKNKRNGNGISSWKNGNRYEGHYIKDEFDGKGTYMTKEGEIYEGDWKNNEKNGYGIFISSKGEKYEGNWIDGKFNGFGKFYWVNGDRFEGEWDNDVRNGKGKYFYSNGDIMEGNYVNDNPDGDIKYYVKSKDEWKEEKWENGKKVEN